MILATLNDSKEYEFGKETKIDMLGRDTIVGPFSLECPHCHKPIIIINGADDEGEVYIITINPDKTFSITPDIYHGRCTARFRIKDSKYEYC